jgi:hypothetical protein
MALHHHSAQVYPKIVPKIHPRPPQAYTVRVDPYAHQQHVKVLKNYAYIAYGCGIHSTGCLSLNHGIASSPGHRSTHTPDLHWCNTVRVDPYAHPQHFKVHTYAMIVRCSLKGFGGLTNRQSNKNTHQKRILASKEVLTS